MNPEDTMNGEPLLFSTVEVPKAEVKDFMDKPIRPTGSRGRIETTCTKGFDF
jgi:hypothetical protein